ncbi:MAG: hypothetical protein U0M53_07260 [Oscillospiraceae bacterium]|nr:hypothetical protein [Oscillospiraceae bacterium]
MDNEWQGINVAFDSMIHRQKEKALKLSFQGFLPGGDKRDRTADLLNAIVTF